MSRSYKKIEQMENFYYHLVSIQKAYDKTRRIQNLNQYYGYEETIWEHIKGILIYLKNIKKQGFVNFYDLGCGSMNNIGTLVKMLGYNVRGVECNACEETNDFCNVICGDITEKATYKKLKESIASEGRNIYYSFSPMFPSELIYREFFKNLRDSMTEKDLFIFNDGVGKRYLLHDYFSYVKDLIPSRIKIAKI